MAHPYRAELAHHNSARLARMTSGYGAPEAKVTDNKKAVAKVAPGAERAMHGEPARFARGGKVKHHAKTHISVNVMPQGGAPQPVPVPMPVPGGAPAMPPPRPPMAGAMAGPPVGGPPGMPPGMPMHKNGGRAFKRGGSVGPAWKEGMRNATQVKNSPGKNDLKDVNRPPVITRKDSGRLCSEPMHTPTLKHAAGGGLGRIEKIKLEHKRG